MNNQNDYTPQEQTMESPTRLRDLFENYLAHWKWFVVGILFSILGAYIYTRYTPKLYEARASILIKDDEKGNIAAEFSAFKDLDILEGKKALENEIEILKSRRLMSQVVTELGLNVHYLVEEGPLEKEYYQYKPLKISFMEGDSSIYKKVSKFSIADISATGFTILNQDGNPVSKGKFGGAVQSSAGNIVLTPTPLTPRFTGKSVKIVVLPIQEVVDHYLKQIKIQPINEDANVIDLRLIDPSKEKSIDILNTLIKCYNSDAINDKNQVATNTANFITERINFVTNELSDVESEVEQFKTKNQLVDMVSEAGLFLENGSENNKLIIETNTQLRLVEYMVDYVENQRNSSELVPANIGITDPAIVGMTDSYNKLVLERNRLLKSSSDKNPVIVNLDEQLYNLNRNLKASLNNQRVSLSMRLKTLMREDDLIQSKIASVPRYEREYRVIQRQQQIKESLYLYLLQKREETGLSLAVTVANAKIIDDAYSNGNIVSPKRKIVYPVACIIGLIVVVGIVYLKGMISTKVQGKKDLEKLGIPYVGDVPKIDLKERLVVKPNDNSPVSEAFRLARTNLSFMLGASVENKAKMLFVTSTISKEGKSFISLNLAATYALSDKKVLLIGTDLRAPKLQEYLGVRANYGVTNFITNPNLTLDDLAVDFPGYPGMKIVTSGPIPPNPAELLASHRVKELFDAAKEEYDVVIVDTAPMGLVVDTLLMTDYADLFLYVVRNKYLDRRMLQIPENLYKQKRIQRMALLLNSVDQKRDLGYGYGYGYGYGVEIHRPWWKKLLRIK
jgi:tyrosine-protein kinase Etk/Wzc